MTIRPSVWSASVSYTHISRISPLKSLPLSDAEVVRTRDPSLLETCDVVVDVGGVFDASRFRFDHHQRSFADSMHSLSDGKFPWKTKLSSAGLVYYHFGTRSGLG